WDATMLTSSKVGRLPNMIVDVFLQDQDRKIIIDTKYYASALQSNRGSESFHSGNLYQLFSYLKNAAGKDSTFQAAEGMLLYPQVQYSLNTSFSIQGHRVKVATVDLTQPWPMIAAQLLELLNSSSEGSA
ncbi:MAG: restriction endonuclease, partial [Alphaproteobacteria bacterium]|nr:restriction endonuclease [Alphaproteobacteria bacterium]